MRGNRSLFEQQLYERGEQRRRQEAADLEYGFGGVQRAIDAAAGTLRSIAWRIEHYVDEHEKRNPDSPHIPRWRQAVEVLQACTVELVRIVGSNNSVTLDRARKEERPDDL